MRSTVPWLIVAGLALATLRCTSEGDPTGPRETPPTPGVRTLVVHSPFGAEGAALLDIEGTAVTSVTSDAGAVHTASVGSRLRILIVRAVPGDLSAKVAVSDTATALDPQLLQVSDPFDALRTSLASYLIEVRR